VPVFFVTTGIRLFPDTSMRYASLLTSHLFLALVVMALAHRELAQCTGRFPGKGGFADA